MAKQDSLRMEFSKLMTKLIIYYSMLLVRNIVYVGKYKIYIYNM